MCPVNEQDFENMKVVSDKNTRQGKKVVWTKVHDFLAKNKQLAYTVKEVMDWTNDNAKVEGATDISRTRVYKELEKLVKKGKVTRKYDEAGTGYYQWNSIKPKVKA